MYFSKNLTITLNNFKMKKQLAFLFLSISLFTASCSSDDSNGGNSGIDQSKIHGWWYRNANTSTVSYKAYYFGEDGEYIQDQSNLGMGQGVGTWEWTGDSEVTITPTENGGIMGGVVKGEVLLLTNDSLVLVNQDLRLSRNNPEE